MTCSSLEVQCYELKLILVCIEVMFWLVIPYYDLPVRDY